MGEPTELLCPKGHGDLASNDTVACAAHGRWVVGENGEPEFEPGGWTEVFWDSQTSEEPDDVWCPECCESYPSSALRPAT